MKNKIKNLVEIVKKEHLISKIAVGAIGIGLMGALAWYDIKGNSVKGYKLLSRKLIHSGEISYMIDTITNEIYGFHKPLSRIGMGGVSKFYVPKNGEKYQKLIKKYKEDK